MAEGDAAGTPPADDGSQESTKIDKAGIARIWWREIARYDRAYKNWHTEGEKIVEKYLAEDVNDRSPRQFALLWSNVETLKPALYAKLPTVLCSRRYKDPDPIGRIACELLERSTNTSLDLYQADEVLRMVRDDRLLPGRGQAWVRYEAYFADKEKTKLTGEKVCTDYVYFTDFGHNVARIWKDVWLVWRKVYKSKDEAEERFGEELANKLSYTAKDPADKNGEHPQADKAVIVEVWDARRNLTGWLAKENDGGKELEGVLEMGPPPLKFMRFFPCPEPCYATKTGKSLIPRPDFKFYQDQAKEIDDLTARIGGLTDWLIVKGFIPAGPSSEGGDSLRIMLDLLQQRVTDSQGIFVPVESWIGFTEKGGATKIIDWLPLDMVVQALREAIATRAQLIQDVYQITGISDILRGQTDPNETLGAQELKAQTGSRRVRNAKDEMARFARDLSALVAEVIGEQFQPQTLAAMTGMEYVPAPVLPAPGMQASVPGASMPGIAQMLTAAGNNQPLTADPRGTGMGGPQLGRMLEAAGAGQPVSLSPNSGMLQPVPQGLAAQAAPPAAQQQPIGPAGAASPSRMTFDDKVIAILRSDQLRSFRIEIETDSTIQPDEDAEKQRRVEFGEMFGSMIERAAKVLPVAPQMAPMIAEVCKFISRGFRAGRQLEDVIERTMDQFAAEISAPKPPAPDPAIIEAENKAKAAEMDAQLAARKQQSEEALAARKQESEVSLEIKRMDTDAQLSVREQDIQAMIAHHMNQLKASLQQKEPAGNA